MTVTAMRGHKLEKSRVGRIAHGYASGGAVKPDAMMADAPMAKAGPPKKAFGKIDGAKPKPRFDKFARGGAVKKEPKTNINVIVAPQGGGDKQPMLPPPMAAGPAMPPPPRPPGPPMGGLPGAPPGAMPPGLGPKPFNAGGQVRGRFAKGGAVKMMDGAGGGLGRLQKAAAQKRKGV